MSLHPAAVQCPACGQIVDRVELLEHELAEDIEPLDIELPEKFRDHVRVYARTVHVTRDCARCHERHVN